MASQVLTNNSQVTQVRLKLATGHKKLPSVCFHGLNYVIILCAAHTMFKGRKLTELRSAALSSLAQSDKKITTPSMITSRAGDLSFTLNSPRAPTSTIAHSSFMGSHLLSRVRLFKEDSVKRLNLDIAGIDVRPSFRNFETAVLM